MEDMTGFMCGLVTVLVVAVVTLVGITSSLAKDVTQLNYEMEAMRRSRYNNSSSCSSCLTVLVVVVGLVALAALLLATTVMATPFP